MTSPVRAADLDAVPAAPVVAVLALGSNLGDRAATLASAVAALAGAEGVIVDAVSPVVETAPVGGPEQPDYLNAVVAVSTTLAPHGLLDLAQRVEARSGRERSTRWGPRTLDVDVVTYGSLVCRGPRLELPHPRAHLRAFVLAPWAAMQPAALLPGPHGGRVAELAVRAGDADGVRASDVRLPGQVAP